MPTSSTTNPNTKYCPGCRQEHPVSEFGRNRRTKDGLACYCRKCAAAKGRKFRIDHPGAQSQASAKYLSKPTNADKHRARQAYYSIIRSGKITPPEVCPLCGRSGKIHAHHVDYARPLHVYYACSACHPRLDAMTAEDVARLYGIWAPSYRTPEEILAAEEVRDAA